MKRIVILGATGSVGRSTLDLVERSPDRFEVTAVTAATNAEALADIARRTGAKLAVIADQSRLAELRERLAGSDCQAGAGEAALIEAAGYDADLVIAAIVGCAGLEPVMAAFRRGARSRWRTRKHCTAGALMIDEAVRQGHAVTTTRKMQFQCLAGAARNVARLI